MWRFNRAAPRHMGGLAGGYRVDHGLFFLLSLLWVMGCYNVFISTLSYPTWAQKWAELVIKRSREMHRTKYKHPYPDILSLHATYIHINWKPNTPKINVTEFNELKTLWSNWNIPYITKSIPSLLMPWIVASPGYQMPCYWLCTIIRSLSSMRNKFSYLHHFMVNERLKLEINFPKNYIRHVLPHAVTCYIVPSNAPVKPIHG